MLNEKMRGTRAGWKKHPANPVLGGNLGTCFDVSVLSEGDDLFMYFSWRDRKCIAVVQGKDGIHWSEPEICIGPRVTQQGWEDDLNRPSVLKRDGCWHMWYTGQYHEDERNGTSQIFHAVSKDGIRFERTGDEPVLRPDTEWEKTSTMNPCVLWDETVGKYRMWYSAGAQYEPKAIGYAESEDGLHWRKNNSNPVFQANASNRWECHKTAGCQVIKRESDFLMLYIGYYDEDYAQIGMAKSGDGISDWVRFEQNPIVAPDEGAWDGDADYKPFAVRKDSGWMLWYNGRLGSKEQIGLVIHDGEDLGF